MRRIGNSIARFCPAGESPRIAPTRPPARGRACRGEGRHSRGRVESVARTGRSASARPAGTSQRGRAASLGTAGVARHGQSSRSNEPCSPALLHAARFQLPQTSDLANACRGIQSDSRRHGHGSSCLARAYESLAGRVDRDGNCPVRGYLGRPKAGVGQEQT
jgi:hypothetical protein